MILPNTGVYYSRLQLVFIIQLILQTCLNLTIRGDIKSSGKFPTFNGLKIEGGGNKALSGKLKLKIEAVLEKFHFYEIPYGIVSQDKGGLKC